MQEYQTLDNSYIFRRLQEADWEAISKELLAFAKWRADRYHWRSGSAYILPDGYELCDIVQHVIEKTINGDRKWDPDKGELLPWLKDQVKSVIDALANSAPHRREVYFSDIEEESDLTDQEELVAQQIDPSENQDRLTPEEVLLETESEEERRKIVLFKYSALFYAVEGDEELEAVIDAVINGCELKPRFLAQKLNVPVTNINNRLKRLQRKALSMKVEE